VPSLEQSSSPAEPLAPILRRVGLKGRVGELYLRILERDVTEAISDRCGALLTRSRSQGRLLELARARWTAAAAENQWYLILTELKRLDEELLDDARSSHGCRCKSRRWNSRRRRGSIRLAPSCHAASRR
jgi:hypothetical protein